MHNAAQASDWPTTRLANVALWRRVALAIALGALIACTLLLPGKIRIVEQFGITYLPLHVIRDQKLIEKHGKAHGLPKEHWAQLHSTNPLEHLNSEIKRRTDVVATSPTRSHRASGRRAPPGAERRMGYAAPLHEPGNAQGSER